MFGDLPQSRQQTVGADYDPDLLECPYCFKTFSFPVSLPCGHTLCRACANDLVAHQKTLCTGSEALQTPSAFTTSPLSFPCPICSARIPITDTPFPENEPIWSGVRQLLATRTAPKRCPFCDQRGCTRQCSQCDICTCDDPACIATVTRLHRRTTSHEAALDVLLSTPDPSMASIYPTGDITGAPALPAVQYKLRTPLGTCKLHGELLRMFCCEDQVPVCSQCLFVGPHRDEATGQPHAALALEQGCEAVRALMGQLEEALKERALKVAHLLQQNQHTHARLEESAQGALAQIDGLFEGLLAAVTARRLDLRAQCLELLQSKASALDGQHGLLNSMLGQLTHCQALTSDLWHCAGPLPPPGPPRSPGSPAAKAASPRAMLPLGAGEGDADRARLLRHQMDLRRRVEGLLAAADGLLDRPVCEHALVLCPGGPAPQRQPATADATAPSGGSEAGGAAPGRDMEAAVQQLVARVGTLGLVTHVDPARCALVARGPAASSGVSTPTDVGAPGAPDEGFHEPALVYAHPGEEVALSLEARTPQGQPVLVAGLEWALSARPLAAPGQPAPGPEQDVIAVGGAAGQPQTSSPSLLPQEGRIEVAIRQWPGEPDTAYFRCGRPGRFLVQAQLGGIDLAGSPRPSSSRPRLLCPAVTVAPHEAHTFHVRALTTAGEPHSHPDEVPFRVRVWGPLQPPGSASSPPSPPSPWQAARGDTTGPREIECLIERPPAPAEGASGDGLFAVTWRPPLPGQYHIHVTVPASQPRPLAPGPSTPIRQRQQQQEAPILGSPGVVLCAEPPPPLEEQTPEGEPQPQGEADTEAESALVEVLPAGSAPAPWQGRPRPRKLLADEDEEGLGGDAPDEEAAAGGAGGAGAGAEDEDGIMVSLAPHQGAAAPSPSQLPPPSPALTTILAAATPGRPAPPAATGTPQRLPPAPRPDEPQTLGPQEAQQAGAEAEAAERTHEEEDEGRPQQPAMPSASPPATRQLLPAPSPPGSPSGRLRIAARSAPRSPGPLARPPGRLISAGAADGADRGEGSFASPALGQSPSSRPWAARQQRPAAPDDDGRLPPQSPQPQPGELAATTLLLRSASSTASARVAPPPRGDPPPPADAEADRPPPAALQTPAEMLTARLAALGADPSPPAPPPSSPPPPARAPALLAVVLGGYTGQAYLGEAAALSLSTDPRPAWSLLPTSSPSATRPAARRLALGGGPAAHRPAPVLPALRHPRYGMASAVLHRAGTATALLYALGGYDGGYSTAVECLDMATGRWAELPPLPHPTYGAAAAAVRGRLYLAGGYDGVSPVGHCLMLDPPSGRWTPVSALRQPRYHLAVAACEGTLYALGGYDGKVALSVVERWDPRQPRWETVAPMRRPRNGPAAALLPASDQAPLGGADQEGTLAGRVVVMGGHSAAGYTAEVEIFEPRTNGWLQGPPLRQARMSAGACALYNPGGPAGSRWRLCLAGGMAEEGPLGSVEVLDNPAAGWTCLPQGQLAGPRTGACCVALPWTLAQQ
ncbi:putative influenza virus NS1A-binding protein [Paratrimastix pyriformis]|uniref:Influenza virus NS1A-binding protein n=1 Tax=Paratrimastix pyriformis TaxID=342808 RepID=A0ABQ8URB4_9EUKA|nr:putative influenza virus NS1A-binding protein [Paratrimastix pyriformis]